MSIPIPDRLRWTRRSGRLVVSVTIGQVDCLVLGLPKDATEADYWEPDRHGLVREGFGQEVEMTAAQAEACHSCLRVLFGALRQFFESEP